MMKVNPGKMSSRDRVNSAIERRPHDRVPRYETFWQDTIDLWIQNGYPGGRESAMEELQVDLACVGMFPWAYPFPGRKEIISEDETIRVFKDEWGATLKVFTNRQTTPEHLGWECDSSEAWFDTFRDKVINEVTPIDMELHKSRFSAAQRDGRWAYLLGIEPFEMLRKLIGDVEAMMAIREEPEWIADMAEVLTHRTINTLQRNIDAGLKPDGLWIYGDMAYNHATFCSPSDYKNLIWPQHKKLCDWAHELGMKAIYHTDGNVNGVVDLFIEAGIDVLQPLECKAGMDINRLIPNYGKDLSFFGNIDVMILIRGDLEEIEEEIKSKLSVGMENNGYIFHSDHSIPPQVSWETYKAMIGMVERWGNYA